MWLEMEGSVQARVQKRHEAYLHGQRPVRGLFSPPDSPLPAGLTLHCRSPYTQSYHDTAYYNM